MADSSRTDIGMLLNEQKCGFLGRVDGGLLESQVELGASSCDTPASNSVAYVVPKAIYIVNLDKSPVLRFALDCSSSDCLSRAQGFI